MYDDLLKQNIVVQLKKLVKDADNDVSDIDSYTDFMREVILNTYSEN
ncbi:hypothetical protein J6G99_03125 [bacterium]|nr:hypothetical protein [bacterium]